MKYVASKAIPNIDKTGKARTGSTYLVLARTGENTNPYEIIMGPKIRFDCALKGDEKFFCEKVGREGLPLDIAVSIFSKINREEDFETQVREYAKS